VEVIFEDNSIEEELQESILKMTPYPNGEGIGLQILVFSATHRGLLSRSWSQLLIKKFGHLYFPAPWNNKKKLISKEENFE
jgi:hypothetical protein